MKRKNLQKWNLLTIFTLLLVFLFNFSSLTLSAQPAETYVSDAHSITVGTSDTRIFASIYETGNDVTMKVRAIGELDVDMLDFNFFYDPEVLILCDKNGDPVNTFGVMPVPTATLSPDLVSKGWECYDFHREKGESVFNSLVSGHTEMNAVVYDLGVFGNAQNRTLAVEAGKVKEIFEIKLKKIGAFDLTESHIGIGVKATDPASGNYRPMFGQDGLFVVYRNYEQPPLYQYVKPELFMYRSGQIITTNSYLAVATTEATLSGTFAQGKLPESDIILDITGSTATGDGLLRRDRVTDYGFIYTLASADIQISIDEFTNTLMINGTAWTVPSPAEIAAGSFTRDNITFIIAMVGDNQGLAQTNTYDKVITGLTPNETYYYWAYDHYYFQTSDTFQFVGNRQQFTTQDCVALNIHSIFSEEDPTCGEENGEIQVFVTGGSGSYEYSVNGGEFATYQNGLITGLAAGSYVITVRDVVQSSCPVAHSESITLYSQDSDMQIFVTANTVDDCNAENGILYVSVTGGSPEYTFYLNGEETPVNDGKIENLAPGFYVVDVEDGSGCIATSGEVHIAPVAQSFAVAVSTPVNTECGQATGAITFTVTGSNKYYYSLSGYPTIEGTDDSPITWGGLSAGKYTLFVTDSCSVFEHTFEITNGNNGFAFTATPQNEVLACDGVLTPGSIVLNVFNGTATHYRIDGGAWEVYTSIITNLTSGIYVIEVKDETTGCTYKVTNVTIGRDIYTPISIGTLFAATDPSCEMQNGEIQVYATGGSGSYLFSIDGGITYPYNTGTIGNLGAGTYQITVKDANYNLCPATTSGTIVLYNTDTDLQIFVTAENAPNCTDNGKLYITVTGGTGQYEFYVDGGANPVPVIDGMISLPAGPHFVNVVDGSGCVASSGEVRIYSDIPSLAINAYPTINHTECGFTTGAITFNVAATGNYTYQLNGYPEVSTSGSAPITITGIPAGKHFLRVYDNCTEDTLTFNIYNTDENGFKFEAFPSNEILACSGELIPGSISLNVTGGTPDSLRIDGGKWIEFTSIIEDLHNGIYVIEVKDENGCTYQVNNITIEREIYTPIKIGSLYAVTEPECGNNDGEIYISVTGGSGNYEYYVNGLLHTNVNNGVISGLTAGTYQITVKDAGDFDCPEPTSGTIVLYNSNSDLQVVVTTQDASTCTATDGALIINVTGGTAPYTYIINGEDETDNVIGGIYYTSTGEYVVQVEDAAGCAAGFDKVRITSNASNIAINDTNIKDTECGFSTGAITFNVTEAVDNTYTYQLDGYTAVNVTGNTPVTITGLPAGEHTLIVHDICGADTLVFNIFNGGTNGLAFTAHPQNEIVACNGEVIPGSITLTVTGGNPTHYRIDGGVWEELTSNTITGLTNGIYVIEVKDAAGCTYQVNNVTIGRDIYPPISIGTVFAATEPTCGNADGSIQVYVTGGSGQYIYYVNGTPCPTTDGLLENLSAGTYTISVTDAVYQDCGEAFANTITLHNGDSDMMVKVSLYQNANTCISEDGILHVAVTGGTAPYTYWIDGAEQQNVVDGYITGLTAGVYVIEVKDASDCSVFSEEIRVHSDESQLGITGVSTQESTCGSATGAITFTVSNPTGTFTYQLDGNPEVTPDPAQGNTFTITGILAGKHTLVVTDECDQAKHEFPITNGTNGLAFTHTVEPETLECDGTLVAGSITLTVTSGTQQFAYSIDGGEWIPFPIDESIVTIEDLHSGIYQITVKDALGCMYVVNNIEVERVTSTGSATINPPIATTPQEFCGTGATVANLFAIGTDIKWYDSLNSTVPLQSNEPLVDGHIYYASQSVGFCESAVRTAVKVIISDEVVLDPPTITSPQEFCQYEAPKQLTIADIATDGNPNIVWYDAAQDGNILPSNYPIADGATYYAAIEAGTCESATRTAVTVTINNSAVIDAPVIDSPQNFCEGATIASIIVPNNKIVWYSDINGNNPLPATHQLENNTTYYAALQAGACESTAPTPVFITIGNPDAPVAPEEQAICGNATLADLTITGYGIVWYDANGNELQPTTPLQPNTTYWAAQSNGDCVGEKVAITITENCYQIYGTMFPFVHSGNSAHDDLFPVTVKLYKRPNVPANQQLNEILNNSANWQVATTQASYYDATVFIPETPKYPGKIGEANNPGLPIDWASIGKTVTLNPDTVTYLVPGELPSAENAIGMYTFTGLTPGTYVLEISRAGFLTRWGEITVDTHGASLGHRELVAGDLNGDFNINMMDASYYNANLYSKPSPLYKPECDLTGDGTVNGREIEIIQHNIPANIGIYMETKQWLGY